VRPLRTYRVSALVLRIRNLGEADRLLTLLSPEKGKIAALAKGARRPRSKLASLQLFSLATLQLAAGKNLDIITQAVVRLPFPALREEVSRFAYACYLVELADAFSQPGEKNRRLFDLLLSGLAALNKGGEPEVIARAFELRLLDLSGYAPQLDTCVSCAYPMGEEPMGFSPQLGGMLCHRCLPAGEGVQRIRTQSLRALQALRDMKSLAWLPSEKISPAAVRKEMRDLLQTQIEYHLGRRIESMALLGRLAGSRAFPECGRRSRQ